MLFSSYLVPHWLGCQCKKSILLRKKLKNWVLESCLCCLYCLQWEVCRSVLPLFPGTLRCWQGSLLGVGLLSFSELLTLKHSLLLVTVKVDILLALKEIKKLTFLLDTHMHTGIHMMFNFSVCTQWQIGFCHCSACCDSCLIELWGCNLALHSCVLANRSLIGICLAFCFGIVNKACGHCQYLACSPQLHYRDPFLFMCLGVFVFLPHVVYCFLLQYVEVGKEYLFISFIIMWIQGLPSE